MTFYIFDCGCPPIPAGQETRYNGKRTCPVHGRKTRCVKVIKTCATPGCNAILEIHPRCNRKKYCKACAVKRNRENVKRAMKEYRKQINYGKKPNALHPKSNRRTCRHCGRPLAAYNNSGQCFAYTLPADMDLGREEYLRQPRLERYGMTVANSP